MDTEIKKIIKNAKEINEIKEKYYRNNKIPSDLILFSLRTAMQSFCSLHTAYLSKNIYQLDNFEDLYDYEASFVYIELYFRGIIHFQHFFELVIKEIIRKKDESLLFKDGNTKNPPKPFSKVIEVIKTLYKDPDRNVKIIIEAEKEMNAIKELTDLRNNILHRGNKVLRFHEYVTFITKYILPLLQPALNAIYLGDQERSWKYKNVFLKKDPIDELILSMKSRTYDNYDFLKILLLMKISDAAYKNPLSMPPEESNYKNNAFYRAARKRYEIKLEQYESRAEKIFRDTYEMSCGNKKNWQKKCVVCGLNTLIIEIETDYVYNEQHEQSLIVTDALAHCECCSFELDNALLDPVKFGYEVEKLFSVE